MEEWRIIAKAPSYEVSNLGNIRNKSTKKLKSLRIHKRYVDAALYISGCRCKKTVNVHRLVAEAFLEDFTDECHIDHINRNPIDNRLDNLRCVTPRENNENRGIGIRTIEKIIKLHKQGLTPDEILDIR